MAPESLGHYRIVGKLSEGGWGTVYLAHDGHLDRDVALKFLSVGTLANEDDRKRFRKEALTVAKLNHPNIGQIYDFDTQEGVDFLVMEYVSGGTLSRYMEKPALSDKQVAELGLQIAKALEEAHEHGIIHRDLKPANIAITPKGHVKVLDFGLAKLFDPSRGALKAETLTQSVDDLHLVGTLPYMAPEQVNGDHIDARTDIYALGAVLYEIVTRQRPFREDSTPRLFDSILHQAVVPPRALNPRISPDMERIILKCLEKDPQNRYQSAKELEVDLRRLGLPMVTAATAVPVSGRRVSATTLAIASVVVVAMLVAAATYFYFDHNKAGQVVPQITSLAVLPLANLSGDTNQEYFADGMTEALITDLSKIRALKVISRTSVMHYKGTNKPLPVIARELGVDGIVEGSVLRSGDRVRIAAQLIDATSDTHLWADNFDRDLRDVLTLQSEVARTITQEIHVAITPAEQQQLSSARVVNPEAHELYLKGRYHWWKRNAPEMAQAVELFEQAIAMDPGYALAYAGLADTYSSSSNNGFQPPAVGNAKAKSAALKAVALDDSLAEAHIALGRVYRNYDWDWPLAEAEYRRAIALNPNSADAYLAYAALLTILARHNEAVAANQRAHELDPVATRITAHLAWVFLAAKRYDEAIATAQKALELEPGDIMSHVILGRAYLQKRMYANAVTALEQGYSANGANGSTALVGAYVAAGRTDDARRVLADWMAESKRQYMSPYLLAMAHVGIGKPQEVFDWLEKSYRERDPYLPNVGVDPLWDPFRADPRFVDLLRRIGLPQ